MNSRKQLQRIVVLLVNLLDILGRMLVTLAILIPIHVAYYRYLRGARQWADVPFLFRIFGSELEMRQLQEFQDIDLIAYAVRDVGHTVLVVFIVFTCLEIFFRQKDKWNSNVTPASNPKKDLAKAALLMLRSWLDVAAGMVGVILLFAATVEFMYLRYLRQVEQWGDVPVWLRVFGTKSLIIEVHGLADKDLLMYAVHDVGEEILPILVSFAFMALFLGLPYCFEANHGEQQEPTGKKA